MQRMVWLAGFILVFATSGMARGQGIRGLAGAG
jgi:hypothetical protein